MFDLLALLGCSQMVLFAVVFYISFCRFKRSENFSITLAMLLSSIFSFPFGFWLGFTSGSYDGVMFYFHTSEGMISLILIFAGYIVACGFLGLLLTASLLSLDRRYLHHPQGTIGRQHETYPFFHEAPGRVEPILELTEDGRDRS